MSGFDISPVAIEIAQLKAQVNNVRVDFALLDAVCLNYEDNYFDFVIGFEAFHHVITFPNVPQELVYRLYAR